MSVTLSYKPNDYANILKLINDNKYANEKEKIRILTLMTMCT